MAVKVPEQIKAFDPNTGAPLPLPEGEVEKAIAAGTATLPLGIPVTMISPSGQEEIIQPENVQDRIQWGYRFETTGEMHEKALAEEYGGVGSSLRAGLEGTLRGATVGLSDPVLLGLGVEKEGLAEREARNVGSSGAGVVAGSLLPLAVTYLSGGSAAPAIGSAAAAGTAARAAAGLGKAALGAAKVVSAPAALVGRAGAGVAEWAASGIGSSAARGLGARIAAGAIPMAAGSAVESLAYTYGGALTEDVLHDKELTASILIERGLVGLGLGLGIGGVIGGATGAFSRGAKAAVTESAPSASKILTPDEEMAKYGGGLTPHKDPEIRAAIDEMRWSQKKKDSFTDSLTARKDNADEIIKNAGKIGLTPEEVTAGMLAKDVKVQKLEDTLVHSPFSTAAERVREKIVNVYAKITDAMDNALGRAEQTSALQTGDIIKKGVATRTAAEGKASEDLHNLVKSLQPKGIAISSAEQAALVKRLQDVTGGVVGTTEAELVNLAIRNAKNITKLEVLEQVGPALMSDASAKGLRGQHSGYKVKEILDEFIEKRMEKEARKFKGAKAHLEAYDAAKLAAKKNYAPFIASLKEMAANIGMRMPQGGGIKTFLAALDDIEPERIVEKFFQKKNYAFMKSFSEKFPEEAKALFNHVKGSKFKLMNGEQFNIGSSLKAIEKFEKESPELFQLVFNKSEQEIIKSSRVVFDSLPTGIKSSKFNPSGTAHTEEFYSWLKNPIKMAGAAATEAGTVELLEQISKYHATGKASGLLQMARVTEKASSFIKNSVVKFINEAPRVASAVAYGAGVVASKSVPASAYYMSRYYITQDKSVRKRADRAEYFRDRFQEVAEAYSNPERIAENMAEVAKGLSEMAPTVVMAMQATATRAISFLYQKAPKNPLAGQTLGMNYSDWAPSDAEISKWERYVTAVDHPMSVLHDLKNGTMSQEASEALEVVHPALYDKIKTSLIETLSDHKKPIPYQKRIQIGTLFDLPADPSLLAKNIALAQSSFVTQPIEPKQNSGNLEVNTNNRKSETEKVMTREG